MKTTYKIDDSIYLNQMELEYSNINEFHNRLEQKAYTMIGIIGVVISIIFSIILNFDFKSNQFFFGNLKFYLILILFGAIICFMISMFLFLVSLHIKPYDILPKFDSIIEYYELEYYEEDFYQSMLGDYGITINKNLYIIKNKYVYVK